MDGRTSFGDGIAARDLWRVPQRGERIAFSYQSLQTGLGVLSSGSSGWGVGLEDFDNDGWKDLFVAQGHVLDNVEAIRPIIALSRATTAGDKSWGPGSALNGLIPGHRPPPVVGRGAAFGDLNNNGRQDVVMTVLGADILRCSSIAAENNIGSWSSCVAHAAAVTAWALGFT